MTKKIAENTHKKPVRGQRSRCDGRYLPPPQQKPEMIPEDMSRNIISSNNIQQQKEKRDERDTQNTSLPVSISFDNRKRTCGQEEPDNHREDTREKKQEGEQQPSPSPTTAER